MILIKFFKVSAKQINGFAVLVILIFFLFLIPEIYVRHFFKAEKFSESDLKDIKGYFRDLDSLEKEWETTIHSSSPTAPKYQKPNEVEKMHSRASQSPKIVNNNKFEPFMFNPNEPDSVKWLQLDLKPRQILTIKNYLKKGGKFRFREDFRKIYGLSEEQYLKLEKYMLLPYRDSVLVK